MRDLRLEVHREVPRANQWLGSGIFILQHLFPRADRLERLRKKNVLAAATRMGEGQKIGKTIEVERRKNLEEAEFVREYFRKGVPVVFDGQALDWECTRKWGLEFLKENYGDEPLHLVNERDFVEADSTRPEEKLEETVVKTFSAREFVTSIAGGAKTYLRAYPILDNWPELFKDLDLAWLKKMRRSLLGASIQSFLGAGGQTTPIHSEVHAFFFILLEGEKQWTLFPTAASVILDPIPAGRSYIVSRVNLREPDFERHPGFDRLTRYTCRIKKGDILFVPSWMWHQVDTHGQSWGLSYRMTYLRGFFSHAAFAFVRCFLARPSLVETLFYALFRRDMGKRKKNLMVPKIFFR